jgi:hypothetical protein
MSIAELRGKLTPEEESAEDLLTSEVFSALELLGYPVLRRWLSGAIAPLTECRQTFSMYLPESEPPQLSVLYWPWIPSSHEQVDGCEPDVVIQVRDCLVIVEMKYKSAKSGAGISEEEVLPGRRDLILADQLGREWFAGKAVCDRAVILPGISEVKNWIVLYVTQGYSAPIAELQESATSICRIMRISQDEVAGKLYWTNYQALFAALGKEAGLLVSGCRHEVRILEHLSALLAHKGLVPFMGFESCRYPHGRVPAHWRFDVEGKLPWPSWRNISGSRWAFRPSLFTNLERHQTPKWRERDYDFFKGGMHEIS